MTHTFVIEVETDALSPDDITVLHDTVIHDVRCALEYLGYFDHVVTASWHSFRGYIVGSGESTSDVCAPESPDMRYQS
jgi:hypothetical protein